MGLVDHESSFQVDFPLNAAFDVTAQHLQTMKECTVDRVDTILHKINLKAGISLFSWGENITVTFKEVSGDKTEISILSTPKTGAVDGGVFDMGKNRKNIDKIAQVISDALQTLQQNTTPVTETNSSKEFAFTCPHCSQSLECPPELENMGCECPNCNQSITPTREIKIKIAMVKEGKRKQKKRNVIIGSTIFGVGLLIIMIWAGTEIWDHCTISADEYALNATFAAEAVARSQKTLEADNRVTKKFLNLLKDYPNSSEHRSVIRPLEDIYGDLGAKFNNKGSCTNIREVTNRVNEECKKRMAKIYNEIADVKIMEARAAYMKAKGSEWFTTEPGAGKEFDAMMKNNSALP